MALTMGLGMVMTKSLKSLRMTRLRRRVLRRALPEQRGGGASNKYTFCKVLQLGFRK